MEGERGDTIILIYWLSVEEFFNKALGWSFYQIRLNFPWILCLLRKLRLHFHIFLNRLTRFANKLSPDLSELSYKKLETKYMYSNKRFSSLSGLRLFVVKKWLRKKGKGHLVGFYMTQYTASHTPFKIVLVFLIQGKNHCLLYLNWALFCELCYFSWYLQVITRHF